MASHIAAILLYLTYIYYSRNMLQEIDDFFSVEIRHNWITEVGWYYSPTLLAF